MFDQKLTAGSMCACDQYTPYVTWKIITYFSKNVIVIGFRHDALVDVLDDAIESKCLINASCTSVPAVEG